MSLTTLFKEVLSASVMPGICKDDLNKYYFLSWDVNNTKSFFSSLKSISKYSHGLSVRISLSKDGKFLSVYSKSNLSLKYKKDTLHFVLSDNDILVIPEDGNLYNSRVIKNSSFIKEYEVIKDFQTPKNIDLKEKPNFLLIFGYTEDGKVEKLNGTWEEIINRPIKENIINFFIEI